MGESYNIKIAVDSRSAQRGVKAFTTNLEAAFTALRKFDTKSKSAFTTLDKFSKINSSGLSRAVTGISAAVNRLNKVKFSKSLISNLTALQRALAGIRFGGLNSIKKIPEALQVLNKIKINPTILKTLNELKSALRGFRGPPKSLGNWGTAFVGLNKIKLPAGTAKKLADLKVATKGFVGPAKSAFNLPKLLRDLARYRLSPALAKNVMNLRVALNGFRGPSAVAGRNLQSIIMAMNSANPAKIAKVAAALQRLNGLHLNIGRGLQQVQRAGGSAFGGILKGAGRSTFAMRGLANQISLTYHASTLLRTALGGLTIGTITSGIFETGTAFQSLVRSMGAVATSTDEVYSHLDFLNELTNKLPINLEAAQKSYRKFAVATRLAGFSLKETQGTYEGFATAFAAMGLSSYDQELGFLAIEQMVSKSTIQMEELKRQLADRIPGSVQMLADAMQIGIPDLIKKIQTGGVSAENVKVLAKYMEDVFGGQIPEALKTSRSQLTFLENEWVNLKRTIFNSGFDTGLATMAKTLGDALKTDQFKDFAKSAGKAFGDLFVWIGILGKMLLENADKVVLFLKAFAGWSALIAFSAIIRAIFMPLQLLIGGFGLARFAVIGLGKAFALLASVKALGALGAIGKAVAILTSKVAILGATLLTAMLVSNGLFGDGKMLDAFTHMVDSMVSYMGRAMKKMTGDAMGMIPGMENIGGFGDAFADELKKAQETYETFDDKKLFDDSGMAKRRAKELQREREKAKMLDADAQKLWESLNPIGKANEKYKEQLKLLDEISKKRGVTVSDLQKILNAQTLEDRNPVGDMARGFREELDAMKAKTGEQKAINQAREKEHELLLKGIILNKEQVDTIADYYKGIAMMNGEIGNGIERWTASVGDWNDQMQNAISDGIGSISDELTNFISGAETDFAGLARNILRTFIKISLDSVLKDMFTALGMNGEKKGASMAEQAIEKLSGIGESITTAQTNVYTSGLSINGTPVGDGFFGSPELPSNRNSGMAPVGANGFSGSPELPSNRIKGGQFATLNEKKQRALYGIGKHQTVVDQMKAKENYIPLTDDAWDYKMKKTAEEAAKLGVAESLRGTTQPTTGGALGRMAAANVDTSVGPLSQDQIANLTRPFTPDSSMFDKRTRAAVRTNNPGAMWYAKWEKKYGAVGGQGLNDGTGQNNNIAMFPTKEAGAAAQFDLLNRKYSGMDLESAVKKWSGGNSSGSYARKLANATGTSLDTPMTDILGNRDQAVTFAKTAAAHEAGLKSYPMSEQQWQAGYNLYQTKNGLQQPTMMAGTSLDPAATMGIDQVTTKIKELGSAAQTSVPNVDQMRIKMQETGTTAQTAGQQTSVATQTKAMAEQQSALNTQMAGSSIQMAGQQAGMASPQFQQAGASISTAGQNAQMAATSAATAAPQVGGFGNAITGILGPLASAIPGLGQFGGMLVQLAGSLFSGGGLGGGLFKEGGLSSSPVSTVTLPAGAWANAPHFADGIANTSGGMPAVLHPNEAVIPLTRGRKVAVDLGDSREPRQENLDKRGRQAVVVNINGAKDMDSFKRSRSQLISAIASAQERARLRDG